MNGVIGVLAEVPTDPVIISDSALRVPVSPAEEAVVNQGAARMGSNESIEAAPGSEDEGRVDPKNQQAKPRDVWAELDEEWAAEAQAREKKAKADEERRREEQSQEEQRRLDAKAADRAKREQEEQALADARADHARRAQELQRLVDEGDLAGLMALLRPALAEPDPFFKFLAGNGAYTEAMTWLHAGIRSAAHKAPERLTSYLFEEILTFQSFLLVRAQGMAMWRIAEHDRTSRTVGEMPDDVVQTLLPRAAALQNAVQQTVATFARLKHVSDLGRKREKKGEPHSESSRKQSPRRGNATGSKRNAHPAGTPEAAARGAADPGAPRADQAA
jgi:hypothetical protein